MSDRLSRIQFLTVQEVEKILRVSDTTVKKLVRDGTLSAVRVGRAYRIFEPSVWEYIARQGEPPVGDDEEQ